MTQILRNGQPSPGGDGKTFRSGGFNLDPLAQYLASLLAASLCQENLYSSYKLWISNILALSDGYSRQHRVHYIRYLRFYFMSSTITISKLIVIAL